MAQNGRNSAIPQTGHTGYQKPMGEPLSRKNRVFVELGTFDSVFPDLEDVTVEYAEFNLVRETRKGKFSVRCEGGQMRCSNDLCFRGGYEFDFIIHAMLRDKETKKEIELHCKGDEGTPKRRRGRACLRSIKAVINIKRKSEQQGQKA
jgi:hypothetical protein